MRILITQWSLRKRGGTELFTIEVSLALKARGHDIRVFTSDAGEGAERLRASGVPVHTTLATMDWAPDIIHGQHHPQTMTALARYPGLPAIYYCHGGIPWLEAPPLHPRIFRYVVTASCMIDKLAVRFDVPRERIIPISNFVDLRRFSRVGSPPAVPRRAVLASNYTYTTEEIRNLEEVCTSRGMTLEKFGESFGNAERHPENRFPNYDLAFAIGRTALEALASGCAVITIAPGLGGHLITPENFATYAATNFAPRVYSPAGAVEKGWLGLQLDQYSAAAAAAVTAKVRGEHTLDLAIDRLEAVYQDTLRSFSTEPKATPADDLKALFQYLDRTIVPEIDSLHRPQVDLQNALRGKDVALAEHAARIEEFLTKEIRWRSDRDSLRAKNAEWKAEVESIRKKEAAATLRWRCAQSILKRGLMGRYFLSRIKRLIRLIETGA